MSGKKIGREEFNKVFNQIRAYDPFTIYIDNERQRESAERCNRKIMDRLNSMLSEYDLKVDFLPWGTDCSNSREEAEVNLLKWFEEKGIEVEEAPTKRIWTEEEIKYLIQTNDKVLYGALKRLYSCQTEDEQAIGTTTHYNGAGFNGVDGPFLTSVSKFLIKNGYLTEKQKATTRKLLVKYNKQLTKLSNI